MSIYDPRLTLRSENLDLIWRFFEVEFVDLDFHETKAQLETREQFSFFD